MRKEFSNVGRVVVDFKRRNVSGLHFNGPLHMIKTRERGNMVRQH